MSLLRRTIVVTSGFIGVCILILFLSVHIIMQQEMSIYNQRSFFGILHVYEKNKTSAKHYRSFYHGRIRHGEQWFNPADINQPTSYFTAHSGVALALNHRPAGLNQFKDNNSMKVGVIGLGVGTIAAYGKEHDHFRFYEIDRHVETAAREYFSYLNNSLAEIDVVIGDGRRMLQNELKTTGSQQYDVLIIDAFSGDGVPIHLLTLEASDLYWQHLQENGLLALNITNFHVDLTDVVRQLASHAKKQAVFIDDNAHGVKHASSSDWVIITSNQAFLADNKVRQQQDDWPHELKPIIWSDNFSNLFEVVTW